MTSLFEPLVSGDFVDHARQSEKRDSWKFVVVGLGDRTVVIAGPISKYRYHANLVAQYCDRNEIASAWLKKPDYVEILDREVELRGGGHLLIDYVAQTMKLYGRSTAYGQFAARDLIPLTKMDPFFTGFEVEVIGA